MRSFPLLGRFRSWAALCLFSLLFSGLPLFLTCPAYAQGDYPGSTGYVVTYNPTTNIVQGKGFDDQDITNPVTATLTWQGNGPAPAVIVEEDAAASYWVDDIAIGLCSCGLPNATSVLNLQDGGDYATRYTFYPAPASGTITLPTVTTSGSTTLPDGEEVMNFVNLSYIVTPYPVTINLAGTTPDSNGYLNILIGQHCSASLVGIPSGCTVSNYQWSVTGTTFQTWSADTPSFPVMVGGVQIGIIPENPDATYEVDGPGPLTNSTAGWYWNDLANGKGNNTQETVSCTATVTPPTGQGAALTVTATTPITVWTPVWTATGNGASVVVDNTFQAPDFWLHAGPGPLDFGATRGMTWYASLSPPSAPVPFGIGSLAIVQIITGCDQGMTSNTTPPLSIPGPGNGQTGLDTSWPYGWEISTTIVGGMKYESGDSPGIRVTNLRSAHDNISFEDYLMYCPPSSVQYVPLAKYIWSANMGASLPATGNWINFTGTAGTVTDAQKTGRFLPNNTFPAWTDIVTAQ